MVSDVAKVANYLNKRFSNMVKSLEISKYEVSDKLLLNMNSHPTLKIISKYRNHSSDISLHVFVIKLQVSLLFVDKNTALIEIGCLSAAKVSQETDTCENFIRGCSLFCIIYLC